MKKLHFVSLIILMIISVQLNAQTAKENKSHSRAGIMISLDDLFKLEKLESTWETEIIGFSFIYIKEGLLQQLWSRSNKITEQMKEHFKNIKSGDKIYFEDIKAKHKDGSVEMLPTLFFVIK